MSYDLQPVIDRADASFDDAIATVARYVGFAPVSYGGARGGNSDRVRALARSIVQELQALPASQRPDRCTLHELPPDKVRTPQRGAFPLISAEWRAGDDRPTVLIYGHGDVQPATASEWHIDSPFKAEVRGKDGEARLFGRGTSDDMGGWFSHLAALRAWLSVYERLPLNVRLIIEFEEEIGSPNLMAHIDALGDFCDVDAMVLTDCENPSTDTPGITTSLRGLAVADLVCTAQHAGGHSGLFGSVWPDPSLALILALARLVDDDGRPNFARQQLTDAERDSLAEMASTEAALPERGRSNAEWAWRQPALTVTGTSLPDISIGEEPAGSAAIVPIPRPTNVIPPQARARLSVRIPPGLTSSQVLGEIERLVTESPPPGIRVTLDRGSSGNSDGGSWLYDVPDCLAFDAADRAYAAVWGRRPARIGVGGSIPFVKQFGDRFGASTPLILNGVLDPESALHAPNESLHLGVFRKAIHTNIHLLDAFGKLRKGTFLSRLSRN